MARKSKDVGRPSKLDEVMIAKLKTAVSTSNLPMERIVQHCKITKQSYHNWINKGEALLEKEQLLANSENTEDLEDLEAFDESMLNDHDRLCMLLYQEMEYAYTEREKRVTSTIETIALKRGDWRALQWLLKIWHPSYRTAEIPPELEYEEEDEYEEEEDIFKTPAPSEDEI